MSRDITLADVFYVFFTTRAFATGIPTVLANTPVISAYEDADLTQITAGVVLTVDHDGVVGLNRVTITATGANGFELGKDYHLVITTGTVDSVSVVGEVVGDFQIGRGAAAVDLSNVTDGLGALKTLLDAIPTTAMRGTDSAALASVATEARLSELDEATGGKMANQVDIIQIDTTTDLPAQITALNNVSIADILASQLTESYAADGVAPTLSQAIFLIQQMLGDFAYAGTTLTVRKIDGSTTAATFTLDDATTPNALTRAT